MKKIIILTNIALLLLLGACSESDFDSRYADPDKTSSTSPEKLMTGVFKAGHEYTMPSYYRYFTFETQQIGRFAQTLGWVNSAGMYQGMGESYNDSRWTNFYKMLTQYRKLENLFVNYSEKEKQDNEIFLLCARIFVYDHLQQMVDIWGDMPFKEACFLPLTGVVETSYPSYDRDTDLYKTMLDDLKAINASMSTMNLSGLASIQMNQQDYINGGNPALWRKYCNSLRLRVAARVSDQGSLTSEGRAAIKEMLENPALYPVIDNNSENVLIVPKSPDLEVKDWIRQGFESWAGSCNRASKIMIDELTGDPRLEILFDKNTEGDYVGIDPLMVSTDQQKLFERPTAEGGNFFSAVDSATFSRNESFPGIAMTAAEVDFIKAEAYLKWGAGGDAQGAFESAVTKSIEFYYYLNSLGGYRRPIAAPDSSTLATFATSKWNAYGSKEEAVATQKWLHFGNIQMVQAWNEIRKTNYPTLGFTLDIGSLDCPSPPLRLRYTTNEKSYNFEKYKEVQAKDSYYEKPFWAK